MESRKCARYLCSESLNVLSLEADILIEMPHVGKSGEMLANRRRTKIISSSDIASLSAETLEQSSAHSYTHMASIARTLVSGRAYMVSIAP
jgi:hypothetical protein